MRTLLVVMLAAAGLAHADRTVYRNLDARGGVTYSDRPEGRSSAPVRMWTPANPSSFEYASARLLSDSERIQYLRMQAEDRRPRPIVTYQPGGRPATLAPRFTYPSDVPPFRARGRWDPYLPDSQPPSLERRYHYDGR